MHPSLDEAIRAAGLSAHAASIKARAKQAYAIASKAVAYDEDIATGRSKLGGSPDVPGDFDWPMWKGQPLAFIGQINLAEVAAQRSHPDLPPDGLLSFFYQFDGDAWGFDPADRGSAAVRFTPSSVPLVRMPSPTVECPQASLLKRLFSPPMRVAGTFKPCAIEFAEVASLPSDLGVELDHEGDEAYWTLTDRLHRSTHEGSSHRLMGYATPVQGEMEEECELVTNGLYCGDGRVYRTPEAHRLLAEPSDWMLLLQIDSNDNAGMMWGDAGMIYFWIRRQDLKNMRLERAWCILQCC